MADVKGVKSKPTLQDEFDRLTALKVQKWKSIEHLKLFKLTPEWKEIEDIDNQLWAIKHKMEV